MKPPFPGNRRPYNRKPAQLQFSCRGFAGTSSRSSLVPEKFWAKHGKRIDWFKPFTKVKNTSFSGKVSIKWFEDGITNVCYNCVDRHLKKRGDQTAIIWEGDNPYDDKKITYNELYEQVCRLANVMKSNGVKKGDRVTIYMPMIPEAAYTRCWPARASARSTRSCSAASRRMRSPAASPTATPLSSSPPMKALRGGRKVPLKANTDKAIEISMRNDGAKVEKVLVVQAHRRRGRLVEGRDIWYHEAMAEGEADCPPRR
jgi:acetyl-CoA synthetase